MDTPLVERTVMVGLISLKRQRVGLLLFLAGVLGPASALADGHTDRIAKAASSLERAMAAGGAKAVGEAAGAFDGLAWEVADELIRRESPAVLGSFLVGLPRVTRVPLQTHLASKIVRSPAPAYSAYQRARDTKDDEAALGELDKASPRPSTILSARVALLRAARTMPGGKPGLARTLYLAAAQETRQLGWVRGEIAAQAALLDIAKAGRKDADAVTALRRLIELQESLGSNRILAVNRLRLAGRLERLGQLSAAMEQLRAAYAYLSKSKDLRGHRTWLWPAQAATGVGIMLTKLGALGAARDWFDRADSHWAGHKDRAAYGSHLAAGAALRTEMGDFDGAVRQLERATELLKAEGGHHLADSLGQLGYAHFRAGRFEPALGAIRAARALYKPDTDARQLASSLRIEAAMLRESGRVADAILLARRALALAQGEYDRGLAHTDLARNLMASRNFEGAAKSLRSALAIFEAIGAPDLQADALQEFAFLYEVQGRSKDALQAASKAGVLLDRTVEG
ncbi:MAG: tetratricopeptide repeat protein, partial [Acidimicrobiia bacterium]|nr:tetratricopeptide repeat protein [Acidimicrobiia bacterium]